ILEFIYEPAFLLHVVVVRRSRLEERPYRDHQVEILSVQLINHSLWVGIILVEDELSLAIPPEPVLHDIVDRDVQLAVLLCYAQDFILRFITVLALPESVSPLAEQRRLTGQLAVTGDNLVELRPVEKVVIDHIGDFGSDVQVIGKSIIKAAASRAVPENAVAFARQ